MFAPRFRRIGQSDFELLTKNKKVTICTLFYFRKTDVVCLCHRNANVACKTKLLSKYDSDVHASPPKEKCIASFTSIQRNAIMAGVKGKIDMEAKQQK